MATHPYYRAAMLLVLLIVAASCTSHEQYRTEIVRPPNFAAKDPSKADIERGASGYLLGFVEFDDQGAFWNRDQALARDGLLPRLEKGANGRDMLMVAFVHGWKNNAAFDNGNVKTFRRVLEHLQSLENASGDPRLVVGVYVGWRGMSFHAGPLTNVTFWDRKNTAHKVGDGGVVDLLRHLESMHARREAAHARDRLVIVGHSFGGALVYSAVSDILVDRFVEAERRGLPPRSFGDLLVLINPAFEAQLYDNLYQLDLARKKDGVEYRDQLPSMAILTSETDLATKQAFPIGRYLSTFFEEYADEDQKTRNWEAIGHYPPYKTHRLSTASGQDTIQDQAEDRGVDVMSKVKVDRLLEKIQDMRVQWTARTSDTPCERWKEAFGRTQLERICDGSAVPINSPYLVIGVAPAVVDGHNDLDNPLLIEFLREFVPFAVGGDRKSPGLAYWSNLGG